MVYKRVCRDCPICGSKYLVRLANHLADVHQLNVNERKVYLQEAKLQPKVKVVVCHDRNIAENPTNTDKKEIIFSSPSVKTGDVTCDLSEDEKFKTRLRQDRYPNCWLELPV